MSKYAFGRRGAGCIQCSVLLEREYIHSTKPGARAAIEGTLVPYLFRHVCAACVFTLGTGTLSLSRVFFLYSASLITLHGNVLPFLSRCVCVWLCLSLSLLPRSLPLLLSPLFLCCCSCSPMGLPASMLETRRAVTVPQRNASVFSVATAGSFPRPGEYGDSTIRCCKSPQNGP